MSLLGFLRRLASPASQPRWQHQTEPRGASRPPTTDDRATEDDIVYAYRLILKRDPDPDGWAHYRKLVAQGLSLDRLIRSFANSDEYRLRLTDESTPTPVDLGGYQVCIQKLDTDFGQGIFHTHKYEEHVRRAARENLRPGDVAVDVGANVGVLTFLAAAAVGRQGRVIAVEPNPDNLQLLYRGIVLNDFDNVTVLPYAASNRRTVFSLTGGTSNTHLIGARTPIEGGHFVQSTILDEALGDLTRLDFVKMDIEGHEPQALEGFARTIERHRPVLLVEFNPRCLVDLQQQDPLTFLKQIFRFYPRVRVTSAFDDNEIFESPERVWAYWNERNRTIADQKLLPDRMLHFDLVAARS
jgi:FkbM family methyltransferase